MSSVKKSSSKWKNQQDTSTRTEVLTSPDTAVQEAMSEADKLEHALIVIQGDMVGKVFRLKDGLNHIGRQTEVEVRLDQRAVSSQHASILVREKTAILEDLKSTNGTVLNKDTITRPAVLQSGDLIKIGTTVLRYTDSKLDSKFTESLHQKGTIDSLTGVYNKDYLNRALTSSIEVAKAGYALSLVIFDLDFFKKINDGFGHLAGDYVLKETCRLIKESGIRSEDILGRFGGEEFILIMPDAPLSTAVSVAERIRKKLEEHAFLYEGKVISVTASMGVCSWSPQTATAEMLLERADQLLYHSKQNGRNRVSS